MELTQTRLRIHVPACQGRAFRVGRGELIKVIDLQGRQVADFFAFAAGEPAEFLSAEHTRVATWRLFPRVREVFVTNRRRPIMRLVHDASPGIHDMLIAACDPVRYVQWGVTGWHASCQENLLIEMANLGVTGLHVPQPVNLFMNYPVAPDGSIGADAPRTKPGDHLVLQAELDAYVCVSACPFDLNATNGWNPTDLSVEVGGT